MRRMTARIFCAAFGVWLLCGGAAFSQACSGIPNANTVCAGPPSGGAGFPAFRALVSADTPPSSLQVGTSSIAGGTNGRILFDNLGTLGERVVSGTGTTIATTTGTLTNGHCVDIDANGNLIDSGNASCGGITALTGDVTASGPGSAAATLAWISRVAGKTLTLDNTLIFAGTDSTTMTFPSSSAKMAALDLTDQAVTGGGLVTPNNPAAGNITVDCGKSPLQWILNSGAFTITAPSMTTTNSQNCALRVVNGSTAANAGAVTLAGFSFKSPGGATFSTVPTVSAASVTFTNGSATINWTSNGLPLGSIVFFATSGSLPTNFATATLYYVVTTGANSIQVASTPGGVAITAGSAGSGTQTAYLPSVFDLYMVGINGPVYAQWAQVQ